MTLDSHVPKRLLAQQQWFASIITRPLVKGGAMIAVSPSGKSMEKEAAEYLLPSPTLKPHQRIQIYNQQYWWRLLSTLQEFFPLVVRLFGYTDFNDTLAIPYMQACVSNHWSLNALGSRFPEWAETHYRADDRDLVLNSIALDHAFNQSFFASHYSPFTTDATTEAELAALLDKPVTLQPHIALFNFPYHLLKLREALLKEEPEHWADQPFPKMEQGNFYLIVFRNHNNIVSWKAVSNEEWLQLLKFQTPLTLSEMCDQCEGDKSYEDHLQEWLQHWTALGWLHG